LEDDLTLADFSLTRKHYIRLRGLPGTNTLAYF
jgi:hypothetical protein